MGVSNDVPPPNDLAAPDPAAVRAAAESVRGLRVSATGGEGRVTATVTGTGHLVGVDIDPSLEPHHLQRLGGWVLAAITDARARAREQAAAEMTPVLGDPERLAQAAAAAVPWLAPTRGEA